MTMQTMETIFRKAKSVACGWTMLALMLATGIAAPAFAQNGWKPSRSVMFIVPNAPAGTSDRAARTLQRVMQTHKLVDVPIVIANRPGGNGTLEQPVHRLRRRGAAVGLVGRALRRAQFDYGQPDHLGTDLLLVGRRRQLRFAARLAHRARCR